MSTVLAYKTKSTSILITDTRITSYQNFSINDDNVKMHYIPKKGFIAGVGVGELLLQMQSIILLNTNLDVYRPVLRESFLTAYQSLSKQCSEKSIMERLKRTGICVSWKDNGCCNLRLFSYGFEEGIFRDLKESVIDILYPDDIDEDTRLKINQGLDINNDINYVLLKMLETFKVISEKSKFVSCKACIGIIFAESESPWYCEGNIHDLLELHLVGKMENVFDIHSEKLERNGL
ncbi:hypothetical protein [Clostridium sp. BNL1100]|uniref:hypothetical protein n=1 Tax=Clostridium sp. BNL1100 TaxID=755731 RepID=UPI00024A7412|nr:hypothetical protein [Clostridium sp. BNL1100]AEY67267.1 hypothetical protein Clo1100_3119 [Clostridium sp. BNL1100]